MSSSMRPELLFFVGIDQIKLPNLHGKGERFLDKYLLILQTIEPLSAYCLSQSAISLGQWSMTILQIIVQHLLIGETI
jgi:hypothetical protein